MYSFFKLHYYYSKLNFLNVFNNKNWKICCKIVLYNIFMYLCAEIV